MIRLLLPQLALEPEPERKSGVSARRKAWERELPASPREMASAREQAVSEMQTALARELPERAVSASQTAWEREPAASARQKASEPGQQASATVLERAALTWEEYRASAPVWSASARKGKEAGPASVTKRQVRAREWEQVVAAVAEPQERASKFLETPEAARLRARALPRPG
ncbi:MAG TPA: hypothetical protein VFC44_22315 [Candidatus Saccharimonadales bacterium]|nr:hypothetical protein [Candidatus Saccharimonadales bacterium]